jgi:hypothetical protein
MKLLGGYKAVVRDRGKFYSAELPIGVRQEYRLNQWTYRRRGKYWGSLAVYKNKKAAETWASGEDDKKRRWIMGSASIWSSAYTNATGIGTFLSEGRTIFVFRCQYEQTQEEGTLQVPAKLHRLYMPPQSRVSWEKGILYCEYWRVPSGTDFAERVMLLEEVR